MIPRFGDHRDWFFSHRFGLFVHWGLYALGEWHEQEQFRWPVARDEFERTSLPDDVFGVGPLAWRDLGEEVHDAGITWGAWKCPRCAASRFASSAAKWWLLWDSRARAKAP